MKTFRLLGIAGVAALLMALVTAAFSSPSALAHERRAVGDYAFIVGFLNEPAYVNQQNSIDLTVCKGKECTYSESDHHSATATLSNAVEGAEKTLKVTVSYGGNAPLPLELKAKYQSPGKYISYFLPTQVGAYTFHITGKLGEQTIDEKFTSGPNAFSEIQQMTAYPETKTNTANTQSNGTALESQVKEAKDAAATANTYALVGAGVGLLGLIVAAVAIFRKPASTPVSSAKVEVGG